MADNKLDPIIRLFGGHDLKFNLKSWSVFLSDANDETAVEPGQDVAIKPDHMIVLNGTFQNMHVWEGEVTVRINSHQLKSNPSDKDGNVFYGLIEWEQGFAEGKDLEAFKDGNVTVRVGVTQDTFNCALTLLRNGGADLDTRFRLWQKPENWDGKNPIKVHSIHFYCSRKAY
jgi:hypothetical protein